MQHQETSYELEEWDFDPALKNLEDLGEWTGPGSRERKIQRLHTSLPTAVTSGQEGKVCDAEQHEGNMNGLCQISFKKKT